MKSITAIGIASVMQGCVFPDWIPADQQAKLYSAIKLRLKVSGANITNTGDDLFTRGIQDDSSYYAGIDDESVSPAKFAMAYASFSPEKGCNELITRFWIKRPLWYFPTGEELAKVRKCADEAGQRLMTIAARDEASEVVASAMSSIGPAVYSAKTQLAFQKGPRIVKLMGLYKFLSLRVLSPRHGSPVIRELVEEALGTPQFSEAVAALPAKLRQDMKWISEQTETETVSESAILHASDFLDQFGSNPASLQVWHSAFITKDRCDLLSGAVLSRPDLHGDVMEIAKKRFFFFKPMGAPAWTAWRNSVGVLIMKTWDIASKEGKRNMMNSLPIRIRDNFRHLGDDPMMRRLFDLMRDDHAYASTFYNKFVRMVTMKQITLARDENFALSVATLLHMIKVSNDPIYILPRIESRRPLH